MDTAARLERLGVLVDDAERTSESELAEAERLLGRPLPSEYRTWLTTYGLAATEEYELFLHELLPAGDSESGGDFPVATASEELRALEWALPDDLVTIGGNGGGEMFGLWVPGHESPHAGVVIGFNIGVREDDPFFWILGESWLSFVEGWIGTRADFGDAELVWSTLAVPVPLRRADEELELGVPEWADDEEASAAEEAAIMALFNRSRQDVTGLWGTPGYTARALTALLSS